MGLSRRTFLQAGAVVPMTLAGARTASSPVYLVRTTDRAEGIRRGFAALGMPSLRDQRLVIKPNLNSADPFPASTHAETLAVIVRQCQASGAREITVADRSGMGNTRGVMEKKGIFALGQQLGFRPFVLDDLPIEGWSDERLLTGHWSRGVLFPRVVQEADRVIETCCLKTHRYGGHFTLSLKNSVGLVAKYDPRDRYNYMSELHGSRAQRLMIAEINQLYAPAMVVLDGIEAFTDGGPDSGTLVKPQLMLLGTDRVALDAVGVAILRMHGGNATISEGNIFDQEQIARAAQLGLGAQRPTQIDIVTDDPDSRTLADRIRGVLAKG